MSLDERIGWLLLGCLIGFVMGYIVRSLREIKEGIEEVDENVRRNSDERGFVRIPIVADIALLLVIVLTVWAAFASQRASNELEDTQRQLTRLSVCNQQYLSKTIKALNERTTYNASLSTANVELQKSQLELLRVGFQNPKATSEDGREALKKYFDALTHFVKVTGQVESKTETYPYPTNEELKSCLGR